MAVPTKTSGGGYEIGRPAGRCAVSGREIPPGEKYMAALRETETGLERQDVTMDCWPQFDRQHLLGFWQTTMRHPEQKKQLFVDDEVLCNLFERLAETTEPNKLAFRFVLGLILMRKRMLVYEQSRTDEAGEHWIVRFRGREDRLEMLNPRLTEQQVMDVSQQLGQILNEEL